MAIGITRASRGNPSSYSNLGLLRLLAMTQRRITDAFLFSVPFTKKITAIRSDFFVKLILTEQVNQEALLCPDSACA